MDPELPKQIFRPGYEPQVVKVNISCKTSLMKLLQEAMPSEFAEVKRDSVFAKILAIHENCLGFSGRLVHSLMCRQIATTKLHEHWFAFARRPLRFSMQEFHAVTGLKCKYDEDCDCDFEDWIDYGGYWSRLLKSGMKINIKMIKGKEFLALTRKWDPKDRSRLIFLCVIAGLVMTRDDKVYIPHSYVKLVMDLGKLRKYPWGVDSFDLLIESITNSRKKLTRKKIYVLDGFSYALQIWIMKAIPDIGVLLGRKLKDDVVEHPRCSNWTGAAKVSYEDMKTFLQGLIEASFVSMDERFGKKVEDRFVKLETQVLELRNEVTNANILRNHVETGSTSNPTRSDPSTSKEIQRQGKVENVAGKNTTLFDTLYDVPLSQTSDINPELSTQEILRKTISCLSQDSFVSGFDPTQRLHVQDPTEWLTPKTSFKKEDTEVCDLLSKPSLIDNDRHERRKIEADYPLVFFTEESFEQVVSWSSTHTKLQIGPSVFYNEIATRIIGPREWLHNKDMDAVMYMLQENTSLRRWTTDCIAFMTSSFNNLIKGAYNKYIRDKRKFKLDEILLDYGNGELPSHGRTRKIWDLDVDRIYAPVFVNGNHWISLCISFIHHKIEVFNFLEKNTKEVEGFAVLIPRIVREVQSPATKKHLNITHYSVSYVPMHPGLNRSHCDCGVYALKFIECHVLGLDLSLMEDENNKEAMLKIAIDLWKAANDPVFIERMSKYEPPKARISEVVKIN